MTPPLATSRAPALPPLPDPLPEGWIFTEDDDMGHSFEQSEFILQLTSLLRLFFARAGVRAFVGFDQHIGLDPRDERITVAPDVYVLPQPEPPASDSATWLPWRNHNLVPTLAFEFVSQSNRKKDYLVAPEKYARLGVRELIVFEPTRNQPGLQVQGEVETFRVYRLDDRRQWKQVYGGDGPTFSKVLGLWLHETDEGKLLLTEDRWGKRALLTPEELLQVEQEARRLSDERAEQEAARAEQEAARAEQEAARAEREAARVEQAEAALLSERTSGQLAERARAVLTVLGARGLSVSAEQEAQVRQCSDPATLDRWLVAAATASSATKALALQASATASKPRKRRA